MNYKQKNNKKPKRNTVTFQMHQHPKTKTIHIHTKKRTEKNGLCIKTKMQVVKPHVKNERVTLCLNS